MAAILCQLRQTSVSCLLVHYR